MSHALEGKAELRDLEAIRQTCAVLGWEFREGQRTYKWFGHWVDDSPVPEGMFTPERLAEVRAMDREERKALMTKEMGKCAHAIRVPGANYEVGVIQKEDGTFRLRWDWYDHSLLQKMGNQEGSVFMQRYNLEAAKRSFAKRGRRVLGEEVREDGSIALLVAG